MKLEGKRYPAICEELGISPSAVGRHLRQLQKIASEALEDDAVAIRQIEDMRLEYAYDAIHPDVAAGDLKAIDTAVRIHAARARLWRLDDVPVAEGEGAIKAGLMKLLTKAQRG